MNNFQKGMDNVGMKWKNIHYSAISPGQDKYWYVWDNQLMIFGTLNMLKVCVENQVLHLATKKSDIEVATWKRKLCDLIKEQQPNRQFVDQPTPPPTPPPKTKSPSKSLSESVSRTRSPSHSPSSSVKSNSNSNAKSKKAIKQTPEILQLKQKIFRREKWRKKTLDVFSHLYTSYQTKYNEKFVEQVQQSKPFETIKEMLTNTSRATQVNVYFHGTMLKEWLGLSNRETNFYFNDMLQDKQSVMHKLGGFGKTVALNIFVKDELDIKAVVDLGVGMLYLYLYLYIYILYFYLLYIIFPYPWVGYKCKYIYIYVYIFTFIYLHLYIYIYIFIFSILYLPTRG